MTEWAPRDSTADVIKRVEGSPNTSVNGLTCQLAGKHRCGGAVTLSYGHCLCSAGWLVFGDSDHRDTSRRVAEWIRMKGGTP
jgi:hypothetical protein